MTKQTSTDDPIQVALCGAHGRMGGRIRRVVGENRRFDIVCIIDKRPQSSADLSTNTNVDIVIDFSSDSGVHAAANVAMAHRAALLVGTTGLSDATQARLHEVAAASPVMAAANVSLGVAALHQLARLAASVLGGDVDIDIIEHHHRTKRDAPSGTALALARTIRDAGAPLPSERIHAIRAGDIVGEHTIHFTSPDERLTITHRAGSRDLFARGALRLAAWLVNQPPGMYTVEQALAE